MLARWFNDPVWLWLLVPAAMLLVWELRRAWGSRKRRLLGRLTRTTVILAGVLALADPHFDHRGEVSHVVFVVDRSASVPDASLDEALARAQALRADLDADVRVGLVAFDREAAVLVAPGADWDLPALRPAESVEGSDVEAALLLALSLIPHDNGGEVVLLSDGRPTDDPASAEAVAAARERGIAIDTVPLEVEHTEAAVTGVDLEAPRIRPGATLRGHVTLEGGPDAASGTVTIRIGKSAVHKKRVTLPAKTTVEVPFEEPIDPETPAGALPVVATWAPNSGPTPRIAKASAGALVDDPPKVRIFAGGAPDATALARALRAEGMQVETAVVPKVTKADRDLDDVDLVILANAPVNHRGDEGLPPELFRELAKFVNAGGGLLVTGGPTSFDLGGYGGTELARVLPVEIEPTDPEVEAGASIIIILDRSGSMAMRVGRKSKMELADEGAAASIRLLRPFDRVGVMSVTETVRWELRPQPVRNPTAMEHQVLRIRADGGGIFVYTSLVAAARALRGADTPLRHVILFSDAADSEEKVKGIPFGWGDGPNSYQVARAMKAENITLSVIGIGSSSDPDRAFLQELAKAGGGRFYLTNDATKLRSLFVEETEQLVDSTLHERPFRPKALRAHPGLQDIDFATGPKLLGYQELEPRPTAEVVAQTADGHPLMVTWQYGLGQVVAWASDTGPRWAEPWLGWEGYHRLWTQTARWALRRRVGDDTAVEVEVRGDQAQIRVARRTGEGRTPVAADLRARIRRGDNTEPVTLRATEPGLWTATAPVSAADLHALEILGDGDKVLAQTTFVPPPPAEWRHRNTDAGWLSALAERTGGRFDPAALEPPRAHSATTTVDHLWPYLALLLLLLLPIDAFVRRAAREHRP